MQTNLDETREGLQEHEGGKQYREARIEFDKPRVGGDFPKQQVEQDNDDGEQGVVDEQVDIVVAADKIDAWLVQQSAEDEQDQIVGRPREIVKDIGTDEDEEFVA